MSLIETECLVLRTYSLAEADKIVIMLTRDHGLVRGVAKGAKRLKSKFGSGLEPFSILSVGYTQKENVELVSIRSSELIQSFFAAVNVTDALGRLAYFSDLLISFVPPNEPNEKIYRMARGCLNAFVNDPLSIDRLAVYFEIWILRLSGYLPEWDRCGGCGLVFNGSDTAYIQSDFRLKCNDCNSSKHTRKFAPNIRELVAMSRRLAPMDFAIQTKSDEAGLLELSSSLGSLISNVVGNNRTAKYAGAIAGRS